MDRSKIPVDLILAKLEADARAARQRLEKARDIFQSPLSTDIGATPYELVFQTDRVRLKYYRPETVRLKTPLLLVHGLFNRETCWTSSRAGYRPQSFGRRGGLSH
jgi:polyhydroxyalkanoate synthase